MGDILINRVGAVRRIKTEGTLMDEQWKPWIEHDGYLVSDKGSVKNANTGALMKVCLDRYGYPKLAPTINGQKVYRTVHRMVAMTWIPNPENKPQVNHINGVKKDNSVGNLEWNTASENITHSFETDLNDNKFLVSLEDLETGVVEIHRSIKKIARLLDTCPSVLVPMIRSSSDYPILGRYIIRIEDDEILKNPSNTKNSGIPVYVFDWVDGSLKKYGSSMIAAYFTGIRSLSNAGIINGVINGNGYSVTRNLHLLPNDPVIPDISETLLKRKLGLSRNWVKRDYRYILYNYYTEEELMFDTVSDMMDFLETIEPVGVNLSRQAVYSAISKIVKDGRNGLVKGFGINTDKQERVWANYTEEVILSSKYGCPAPTAIYRLTKDGIEDIVISKYNLCRVLGFRIDGSEWHQALNRLIASYSAPNVSIVRLNSPIVKR